MKNAKRLMCVLLAVCMMFGMMLTSGGAIRAYADGEDVPALPMKIDFESETANARPAGWTDHPDVVKEAPTTSKGITVIDEGNGNKYLEVVSSTMPHALNYLAHYKFQPTDSILLKYRFKLTARSDGAYLIYPVYTGKNAKSDYQCSPLHPFVASRGDGTYAMYYGYSDWKSTLVKEGLLPDQWYELVMLVDLKSDTRKMYIDDELLDLGSPKSVDIYEDKSNMTMNRLAVGSYFQGSIHFMVDDIEVLASAKATEVVLEQMDYTVRVNQSIALKPDFRPLGAEPCTLTYTSADPSVATVDENGHITGVKEGTTTISVETETAGVAPVILNVTVDKEMTGTFGNLPDTLELPLRGHMALEPQLTLDYEGDNTMEVISEDSSIVSVDEWNEVYALAEGQTKLIVRSKEYPTVVKEIPVTVKKANVQQTIYVAPDGTGDGSSESKPTSLDNALTILEGIDNTNMTGNVEVVLADGYYYRTEALALNDKHGGNNQYCVVFKAAEGANPTIGGALHIAGSDFKASDIEGVYVVDVPAGTAARQLYVDNIRAIRAKQEGIKKLTVLENELGEQVGLSCELPALLDCTNPDDVEVVWYNLWTHQRVGVKEIKKGDDGKVQLIMDQPSWGWATSMNEYVDLKVTNISQIENALGLLDEPGEWYLDETANKLYYMPRDYEDMSKVTVTVPALDVWDQGAEGGANAPDAKVGLVTVFGSDLDHPAQNIHFEGITFADTTWSRPSTEYGHISNQSNYIRDSSVGEFDRPIDAAVSVRRANGISFLGCTFTRIGSNAVWMTEGTKNSMLIGNHMFDIDGAAAQLGDPDYSRDPQNFAPTDVRRVIKNNDVLNNYIHNIGVDFHAAAALSIGFVADLDVSYNEIFNVPFGAVHAGYGWNVGGQKNLKNMNLSYNFFHDIMFSDVGDSGGIYAVGDTMGNNKIFNNYFRNQGAYVSMIYFDNGSGYWEAANNVVDVSENLSSPYYADRMIDWAYSASDTHYITVKDNYFWDKDEASYGINGSQIVNENNTRVWGGEWPEEALKVMEEAGLQEAYTGLRNNQIERLYTNLFMGMVTDRSTFRKIKLDTDDPEKKTYQVEVTATDGRDQAITLTDEVSYYIEDETVAYVDDTGLVTALKAGETVLRVYVNSNNVLRVMESKVAVSGETVETRPTEATEATEPTGSDVEKPGGQNPLLWVIIALVAVAIVAVVVILLSKKKAEK